jgi:hypothetical protein
MVKNLIRFLISAFLGAFISSTSHAEIFRIENDHYIVYREPVSDTEVTYDKTDKSYTAFYKAPKGYAVALPREQAKNIFDTLKVRYQEQKRVQDEEEQKRQ